MIEIELEQAIELALKQVKEIEETEEIFLYDALNYVIAEDFYAPINQPPFDRSPLDGYALFSKSTKGAKKDSPKEFFVVGECCAGDYFKGEIDENKALRIMTGAIIPNGANCVIRQEDVVEKEGKISIFRELNDFENYCFEGEDIKKGSILIEKSTVLNSTHIGILASMGVEKVKVIRKARVGLLCTGDELLNLGESLEIGKIYNSNQAILYARLLELNLQPILIKMNKDDVDEVCEKISANMSKIDCLITTGGVSVGKKDIFHQVIPKLKAKRLFWKVKMKPGTPVMVSIFKEKLIISLSGNPFAALVNFELLVRPVLFKLSQNKKIIVKKLKANLLDDFNKNSPNRRFIRAYYDLKNVYLSADNHSSGSLYSMSKCNCLIDIPKQTSKLSKGQEVDIILI